MEIVEGVILLVCSGNFALVVRLIFMLGRSEEKHVSHDRRLTKLEGQKC